jgi:AcrR family transcriptional regulator
MAAATHEELPRRRSDGEATHAAILDTAMRLASIEGLGSLTIGRLARELGISKSGVFAHFRSKDRLQAETVQAASDVFQREVLRPGLAAPEGLARAQALCEAYLSYIERGVFPGGCFFAQLLAEYDAQTGPVHDQVAEGQRGWLGLLEGRIRSAQQQEELDPAADSAQLAFELSAAVELANYWSVLNRDTPPPGGGRAAGRATIANAMPQASGPARPTPPGSRGG